MKILKRINWKTLLISIAISLGVGIVASLLTSDSMQQYESMMYRPLLAPPGWLFPVVWTILYILMGNSAYLIYEPDSEESEKRMALRVYAAQLIANGLWTIIFFRLNAYLLAFAWLLLLWYLIYVTIRRFAPINKLAARLLLPYIVWVTFAGYLNLAIALNT